MRRTLLGVLAALLISAPIDVTAKHVVRHHKAVAQTANANCAFGTVSPPAGTQCGTADLTPGGALANTDAVILCQIAGGCFGSANSISYKSVQLPAYIRSALSGTAPITYNSSTGAFGCSTFGTSTAGCVPASGGGTANYLRADGTWAPTSGSGGGTVTSVGAGTGLSASPSPIVGGGTISCVNFSSTLVGCVPASGGGTTNFLRADGTWAAPPSTGGTPVSFAGPFAGTNTYTLASPTPTGWANTAGYRVCGAFANPNTAAANLAVGAAAALPIHLQTPAGEIALIGGEITGQTRCLTVNGLTGAAQAFILDASVGGGVTVNPGTHPVTASEWAYGQVFVCSANCTLNLPSAATLANQGSITIQTISNSVATLQPTGSDGVNGGAAASAFVVPSGLTAVVTIGTPGSVTAFYVPVGESKIFSVSWGPGMNLATSPIPVVTRTIATVTAGNNCVPGVLVSATPATVDVCYAPDGTVPGAGCTGTGVVKLTSTASCNASSPGVVGTQQGGLIPGGTAVPSGMHLWVVGSGAGWSTGATSSSGVIQFALVP